ncbi:hypothetical protein tinsulaeT_19510 [Thalassotalea insulae]|uniref:HTH cro/C1-type domain-containing protein n=1 Tax=Thalassotalea insulae TaxID=2056778 RepID=A0ABQ6GRR2_9GAMM|nr:helix-turn-helix transcriptional regulator [Thalassotalea insulae]GLX78611.1 hypothetical protein tinsulaeT_19510 [Thalassotalea insulae]
MIVKQLRLSRRLSQEQLAQMSGLNVRTIQRIESGKAPSNETLKCIAAALDVEIEQLTKEHFMIDKKTSDWQKLPLFLKCWFTFNFLSARPNKPAANRVKYISHIGGFLSCCVGLINEAALVGGLLLLANAYLFELLIYQGDKYAIWFD